MKLYGKQFLPVMAAAITCMCSMAGVHVSAAQLPAWREQIEWVDIEGEPAGQAAIREEPAVRAVTDGDASPSLRTG